MPKKKTTKAKKSAVNKNPVIAQLSVVLADLYILAVKTHGFHWNVEGPLFPQLHELFGKQYTALIEGADEVAERIRALDAAAPQSFAQFIRLATISEETRSPSAQGMVAQLLQDYDHLAASLQKGMDLADDTDDDASEDLLTGLLRDAHKTAWMLRAMLRG